MNINSGISLRTANRRKRFAHNLQQSHYIESLPDLEDSEPDNDSLSDSEIDSENPVQSIYASSDQLSSITDDSSEIQVKVYSEIVISAILSKANLSLKSAERVVNLFNDYSLRFSCDPVLLPSVRYQWDKRSKKNPICVYVLCENQHSHGPFTGEPSKYGKFLCQGNLQEAKIKKDRFFLHIELRNQLESHLPTIPNSQWIQTMRQDETNDVSNGYLARNIRNSFDDPDSNIKRITLTIHADEVQAGNSSNVKIFPVFISINDLKPEYRKKNYFLIGLFVGKVKPDVSAFLGPICHELKSLEEYPISWKNSFNMEFTATFHLIALVADAPMRAYMRGARQYNHIYGCDWCLTKATSASRGSRIYSVLNQNQMQQLRRKHEDFINFENSNLFGGGQINENQESRFHGIIGGSPLLQLSSFNIINGIAVEHMHCLILGIFRALFIRGWLGETNVTVFESRVEKSYFRKELSRRIEDISVPAEITRAPRNLDQLKFWKSSEYESFLTYYFLPLMKGLLKPKVINHILVFIRIQQISHCGPINQDSRSELENLIYEFQKGVSEIYGNSFMSYNLHILSHLPDSVKFLGPTKNISSYTLENYMGILKKKVRRSSNIAPSLVRIFINDFRYQEILNSVKIMNWSLTEKEKCDFGFNDYQYDVNEERVISMKENVDQSEESLILNKIRQILDREVVSYDIMLFQTISINGKRFSAARYGKDKVRCDSIIKSKEDEFMEIQYIFSLQNKYYAFCHLIDVSPVRISFRGTTGSFLFKLSHLFEIKKTNNGEKYVKLDHEIKKCFIIASTKYHYKYHRDFLIEPFLSNI